MQPQRRCVADKAAQYCIYLHLTSCLQLCVVTQTYVVWINPLTEKWFALYFCMWQSWLWSLHSRCWQLSFLHTRVNVCFLQSSYSVFAIYSMQCPDAVVMSNICVCLIVWTGVKRLECEPRGEREVKPAKGWETEAQWKSMFLFPGAPCVCVCVCVDVHAGAEY